VNFVIKRAKQFCISMNTASFDKSDIREQVSVMATT